MSFITNMKIGTKFVVSAGFGIVLLCGLIINQYVGTNKILAANQIVDREETILNGITSSQLEIARMRTLLGNINENKTDQERQTMLAELKAHADKGARVLAKPIEIALRPEVLIKISDGIQGIYKNIEAYVAANPNVATAAPFLHREADATANELATAAREIVANARTFMADVKAGLASAIASSNLITMVLSGFAMLGLASSSLFLMRTVGSPVREMTAAMLKLANGDTNLDLAYAGRTDEMGAMAGAIEVFRQASLSNKRLEQEASSNRKQAEADRVAAQQSAEADAAERMRVATSGLAVGLKRLASGDLSFQLNDAFSGDFEGLRHDFNASIVQLREALSSIANAVVVINSGSQEISGGADELAKRTEHQAAALEETAAALDEITVNVASAAKLAEEARQVATEANTSATKSGEVVAQAMNAMTRIEDSSNKISNIIVVIDEIAFQTNLLALNAGVEAARAGEAGRGFAVVAQEVRELAQRSAQAAKEIKGLILASTTEVSNGVKLVSDTGASLQTIGGYVVSINTHMNAIATAAKEQSTGLAEINTAVNHMDQTTQQNAAMVEETNAAAGMLTNEASTLQKLVAQFILGGVNAQTTALKEVASRMAQPVARTQPGPAAASHGNAAIAQDWKEF